MHEPDATQKKTESKAKAAFRSGEKGSVGSKIHSDGANHMTEEEAHRYIQKCSMDSGTSLTETAEMVISMTKI